MPPAKKTAAAKTAAPATPPPPAGDTAGGTGAELDRLRAENDQLRTKVNDLENPAPNDNDAELERLATFLTDSYPTEARTDETPVDVAIRLLDRSRATAPGGVDPASGLPTPTAPLEAPSGVHLVDYTLTAEDVPNGATLTDLAEAFDVDPVALLAYNAPVLDAEAQARGLAHSDNGRIIFAGTTLRVPDSAG